MIADIIFQLGAASLMFLLASFIGESRNQEGVHGGWWLGLGFGAVAGVAMTNPVTIQENLALDFSAGAVVAAGLLAGWRGGLLAAALAAGSRYFWIGPPQALDEILVIALYGAFGVAAGVLTKRFNRKPDIRLSILLGPLSAIAVAPAHFLSTATEWRPQDLPVLAAVNGLGVVLFVLGNRHWRTLDGIRKRLLMTTQIWKSEVELLQAVLNTLSEGVVITDARGVITDMNPSFHRLFGYERAELFRRSLNELFVQDGGSGDMRIDDLPTGDETGASSFRNDVARKKSGATFPVRVSASRFGDPDSPQTVATIIDMTELVDAQAQLTQAQKLEALGRLTGGVAHDFNNILAVIQLNLALLERVEMGEDDHELVADCVSNVRRGQSLTSQLLSFAGRSKMDWEVFRLGAVIEDIRPLIERLVGENIRLALDVDSDWTVKSDRGMLETALLNLCFNARDAMADGGVLRIRVEDRVTPRAPLLDVKPGSIFVEVRDDGAGMTDATRRSALDPFFTTKEKGAGHGLGLSMVHGFVKQSGGDLAIESGVGVGTLVTFSIPACLASDEIETETTAVKGHGERILVVEDNEPLRKSLLLMVHRLDYHAAGAGDARAACALIEHSKPFDLILADFRMPGAMSGLDLLRSDAARSSARILMSAHAEGVKTGELDREGIEFLAKPFAQTELAQAIRRRLAVRSSAPAASHS